MYRGREKENNVREKRDIATYEIGQWEIRYMLLDWGTFSMCKR